MADPLSYSERVSIARLHALLEILPTALDQHLAPARITSFEFTLLEALAESPDHYMRLTQLARKTNATLPRLSRVVSSLEKKGLVERHTCPVDRRANNAFLTSAGEAKYESSKPLYAEATRKLILDSLEELPYDGVEQLAQLCLAMLRHIDPQGQLAVTRGEAPGTSPCAADPEPTCHADPA